MADFVSADLIDAARAGDDAAFAALFAEHFPAAVRMARRMGATDPEDVAANAFADIFALVRRGAGPTDTFAGYLRTSVKRSVWKRVAAERRTQPTDDPRVFDAAVKVPSVVDTTDLVRAAFRTLSPRHQRVLRMLEIDRLTIADVCVRTSLAPEAVRALAYRARRELRAAYAVLVREDLR